jgi:hypothetical protein
VRPKVDCHWENGVPLRRTMRTPRGNPSTGRVPQTENAAASRRRLSLGDDQSRQSRSSEIFAGSRNNSLNFLNSQPPSSTPKRRPGSLLESRRGSESSEFFYQ